MIPKDSALGLKPPTLLVADVPSVASLTSTDEHGLPYSLGSQGKCHGTAQEPEAGKTLGSLSPPGPVDPATVAEVSGVSCLPCAGLSCSVVSDCLRSQGL